MKLVGGMGMSPAVFYDLTYKEAGLILKGYEKEQELRYYHAYYAHYNVLGAFMGGKKFKPIDVFNSKDGGVKNYKKSYKEEVETIAKLLEENKR